MSMTAAICVMLIGCFLAAVDAPRQDVAADQLQGPGGAVGRRRRVRSGQRQHSVRDAGSGCVRSRSVTVSSLQATSCGLEAVAVLLSRASQRVSYRSLCVPEDLQDRGVDTLPQSYYAQDALRVWDALLRYTPLT